MTVSSPGQDDCPMAAEASCIGAASRGVIQDIPDSISFLSATPTRRYEPTTPVDGEGKRRPCLTRSLRTSDAVD